MKKRYLIALDMDGTLLDDKKEISKETKEYLKYLENDGNVIAIASGRPLRAIMPYYNEIGLTVPIACYNGACVLDPINKKLETKLSKINKEIIKKIIEKIGVDNFSNIMCQTSEDAWVLHDNLTIEDFFWKDGIRIHEGNIVEILDEDPHTAIFVLKNHDFDEKIVKIAFSYENIGCRFWGDSTCCELYFLDVNKGSAIGDMAKAYGIDNNNTIAIGDAENDVDLLRAAYKGVAMKNASDELISQADMVSLEDNNHDGVKKTLEYLLITNHD